MVHVFCRWHKLGRRHAGSTVFDGANWATDTQIAIEGMSGSPSAVAWAVLPSSTRGPVTDSYGTRILPMAQTGAKTRWFNSFRWRKLGNRYANRDRRHVGLTLGSSLGRP